LSFAILKIADLTVDGSLVLGASIFARLISLDVHWLIAMAASVIGGGLAGVLVALIQRRNRIDPLIAGILMAFILNSLSLVVMQRPNIGLLTHSMLFEWAAGFSKISIITARFLCLVILALLISTALVFLLRSKMGLWLKAFGNNESLVALLGKNPERLRMMGLSLSNALAAFTGCLTAEASGYADINMGLGQALIGIAMILVGRQLYLLFKHRDVMSDLFAILCILFGVIIYFVLTNEVIRYGLSPVYLKMAIGGLLIIFLWVASDPAISRRGGAV